MDHIKEYPITVLIRAPLTNQENQEKRLNATQQVSEVLRSRYRQEQGKCMSKGPCTCGLGVAKSSASISSFTRRNPPRLAPATTTDISPYRNNLPELRYALDCNISLH